MKDSISVASHAYLLQTHASLFMVLYRNVASGCDGHYELVNVRRRPSCHPTASLHMYIHSAPS